MGTPVVGDVVLIAFPHSDLSKSKRRPALVVTDVGRGDYVLCQITSKPYDDPHALSLSEVDFSDGGLRRESFVRVGKLLLPMRFSFLALPVT
jgi:mRNA interferase MazF